MGKHEETKVVARYVGFPKHFESSKSELNKKDIVNLQSAASESFLETM